MFRYNVECRFVGDNPQLAEQWLDWLRQDHLQKVIDAGARSADVVRIDSDVQTVEIRYQFDSRQAFEDYEKNHAPRLRAEGLAKFPVERGIQYRRWCGEVIYRLARP